MGKNIKKQFKYVPLALTTISLTACVPTLLTITAVETIQHIGDKKHPNVVFVLVDDLGYGDISCLGQEKFSTPNIDKLASQGKLFTQHYSGTSVSAPSRCSLITGLHTGHCYVRGNKELPVEGQHPMPADSYNIFHMMKENGYKTAVFGKWGLGAPNTEGEPNKQGVDVFYGYNCQRQAHNYYPYHLWNNTQKVILEGNKASEENDYAPYLIHSEAIDFIKDNKDTTFFMMYTSILPHAELKLPENEMAAFIENPNMEPEREFHGCDSGEYYKNGGYGSQKYSHAAFAAMVTLLDRQVGELCNTIDSLGLSKNTIIVFTSDNGPHQEGGADPDFFNSNGPLRGYKRDLYEGGIRVPLIVKWDGKIEENTISDHISSFWDLMPTLAEIIDKNADIQTDGISMLPELLGHDEQKKHDYLYWEFHENNGRQAVRKDNWKAVRYDVVNNGKIQLFNLSDDISESKDLASDNPQLVAEFDSIMKVARVESEIFNFR